MDPQGGNGPRGGHPIPEDALLILHRRRFGALPVVEGRKLVGIVTKADILAAFIDTLSIEGIGVRIEVILPQSANSLLRLIQKLAEMQVQIRSLVLSPYGQEFAASLRIGSIDVATVKTRLRGYGCKVLEPVDSLDEFGSAFRAYHGFPIYPNSQPLTRARRILIVDKATAQDVSGYRSSPLWMATRWRVLSRAGCCLPGKDPFHGARGSGPISLLPRFPLPGERTEIIPARTLWIPFPDRRLSCRNSK